MDSVSKTSQTIMLKKKTVQTIKICQQRHQVNS